MATDFESEGLLEGLDGQAKQARLALLEELEGDGVGLDELRQASHEGRLALVPVERILTQGEGRHTLAQVAEQAKVEPEFLERYWRAIGLAMGDPEEELYLDADLEAARRIGELRAAGMTDDSILEIARVMSSGLNPVAVTVAGAFASDYLQEGDDEQRLAQRLAEASRELLPLLGPALEYALLVQQRALVRQASALGSSLEEGRLPDAQEVAICFADLVGFTRMGEGVDAGRLGAVAAQLEDLARDVAKPPVRLVKTIGDEVMLQSSDTKALLEAALALLEAGEAQEGEDDFPQLTIGIAQGEAIQRGGDWFGRPVNLASRVTDRARPDSILVTEEVKEAAGEDDYSYSNAGDRKLKGVEGPVRLFRARRRSDERGSD
jgi:adenylate cyclase